MRLQSRSRVSISTNEASAFLMVRSYDPTKLRLQLRKSSFIIRCLYRHVILLHCFMILYILCVIVLIVLTNQLFIAQRQQREQNVT